MERKPSVLSFPIQFSHSSHLVRLTYIKEALKFHVVRSVRSPSIKTILTHFEISKENEKYVDWEERRRGYYKWMDRGRISLADWRMKKKESFFFHSIHGCLIKKYLFLSIYPCILTQFRFSFYGCDFSVPSTFIVIVISSSHTTISQPAKVVKGRYKWKWLLWWWLCRDWRRCKWWKLETEKGLGWLSFYFQFDSMVCRIHWILFLLFLHSLPLFDFNQFPISSEM